MYIDFYNIHRRENEIYLYMSIHKYTFLSTHVYIQTKGGYTVLWKYLNIK